MGESQFDFHGFAKRRAPPWQRPQGLGSVLEGFRSDSGMQRCITLDHTLPGRAARLVEVPAELAPELTRALSGRGIAHLFSHQAEAYQAARGGQDVVVSTPTASGKSLWYNLPVLDALARDTSARALYLFPTKALARDQEEALKALMREAGLDHGAVTY
ncbi:MAG TPA: DEAD/DEAH box helicase, partial [Polyangiales bacterium]